jgi:hypothetical protein
MKNCFQAADRRHPLFESAIAPANFAVYSRNFAELPFVLVYITSVATLVTTVDSRRETVSLIGSDKVDGTAVYGADDQKIGSVQRVMIDKASGKVAYAVVSFGGFLGMGEDYYPLPWPNLKYDGSVGGYRVGITEDQLKGAPRFDRNTEWDWSDRSKDRAVYDYYRAALWY